MYILYKSFYSLINYYYLSKKRNCSIKRNILILL